jgi:hypothetical protein
VERDEPGVPACGVSRTIGRNPGRIALVLGLRPGRMESIAAAHRSPALSATVTGLGGPSMSTRPVAGTFMVPLRANAVHRGFSFTVASLDHAHWHPQ